MKPKTDLEKIKESIRNNPHLGAIDEDADYNNVVPAIKSKFPSFKENFIYRTPHAGILYVDFKISKEDMDKLKPLVEEAGLNIWEITLENYQLHLGNSTYRQRRLIELLNDL